MTLARLQVRMTFFSERWFIISIFFSSFGAMNGSFFKDLDIVSYLFYLFVPSGFSCCGGGQYTCPSACSYESCIPAWVYPKECGDQAFRSVGGLHHRHADGHGGTSQNHGRLGEHPGGACGLPCRV